MHEVVVSRVFPESAPVVFRRYADHEGWTAWAKLGPVHLVKRGAPDRDGLGAVRSFVLSPGLKEEVVAFAPPADDRSEGKLDYRIIAGLMPLQDHLAKVTVSPEGAGSRLTWRVSFRAAPGLGWVMKPALGAMFRRALRGLARDLAARA